MKPVALGREDWLFAGSEGGGRTATILFSLATTCKAPKDDPFGYLRDVLIWACTLPSRRVAGLLPDRRRSLRCGSVSALAG